METQLWAALVALLLLSSGSAEHDGGSATATVASQSGGSGAVPEAPASSLDTVSHAVTTPSVPGTNPSSRVAIGLSNGTTSGGRNTSLTPGAKTDHAEAAGPELNPTDHLTSQSPPTGKHAPTSHAAPASAAASPTTKPPHTAHTTPVAAAQTTTPPTTASSQSTFPLPYSGAHSTPSSASVSTPEPKATSVSAQSGAASTASSSQGPSTFASPSLPSTQSALQPERRPETSSVAQQKSTTATPSSPSARAKGRGDTPSQLNVGGDTTIVHESPTLDPLLAGLVSAFIITAVIITLLLFLKLRRRDNQPEFRRLQDLPMDDIMEDTPLSMYSY